MSSSTTKSSSRAQSLSLPTRRPTAPTSSTSAGHSYSFISSRTLLTTILLSTALLLLLLLGDNNIESSGGDSTIMGMGMMYIIPGAMAVDPIVIGTLNPFSSTAGDGALLSAALYGMTLSFNIQNAVKGGINGRPLQLKYKDITNVSDADLGGHITNMIDTTANLTALALLYGNSRVEVAYPLLKQHDLLLIQPSSGTRQWFSYDEHYINYIPSSDAELFTQMRYIVNELQLTRVGFISDVGETFGTELLPTLKTYLESVGGTLTNHLKLNNAINPTSVPFADLSAMITSNPSVIIVWGSVFTSLGVALASLLSTMPNTVFIFCAPDLPVIDQVLRNLPSGTAKDRILHTAVGTPYTDTSFVMIQNFRNAVAAYPAPQITVAVMDAVPSVGMFTYFGYGIGQFLGQQLRSMSVEVNNKSFRETTFDTGLYAIDDILIGPFAGKCLPKRTVFCECNNGARQVDMIRTTPTLGIQTLEAGSFTLPLTTCSLQNMTLPSPLVVATISPASSPMALIATSDYILGRAAAALIGGITTQGASIQQTYTGNSTAALQTILRDRLLTASAGSVLNTPIGDATGIGAVIDPMEVRPRLYGGFRRDVVYVSPTYEQELHALASLAVAQGKGITVLSALDEDGSAVGSTLTLSMNTLGQEGGGHRSSASIASGLLATGDGGVTILHGIATSADIAAIATHLGQQTNAVVAIPMAHLLVWYRELVAAVTDEGQRSRIVFATSLPNWAGPVSGETTGPALQTYFDRVPATNRTPGSLRGYMTHQLLTYVSSRVPTVKSPTEFLRMLYGASVIVMDTGLVAGPYFDGACGTSASGSCEMNIGARVIRVRSLSASVTTANGTAAGQDASSITLDSGRISYTGLPTTDNSLRNIIIIVAVVGSVVVLGGVLAVVLVLCCTGRSNRTAPKDESDAFTIIFTDIQSSTNLWAEAPEAMGPALDHHHALIRKLCSKHRGYEVKTIGDAFMVAFKDAADAVNLSSALQFDFYNDKTWSQQIDHAYLEMDHTTTLGMKPNEKAMYSIALSNEDYIKVWNGLRVRIGIHTGFGEIKKDPVSHGYDYYGTVVNTAARTEAIAHGGQVIMTEGALLASNVPRDRIEEMGPMMLRGVPDPVQMYQLTTIPNRVFPPLRVEKAQEDVNADLCSTKGSSQQSTRSHSTNVPPAVLHQRTNIKNTLSVMIAVMAEKKKGDWLRELCKEWRVHARGVSSTRGGTVSASVDSAASAKDTMIESLSTKLAPVLAKRVASTFGRHDTLQSSTQRSYSKLNSPSAFSGGEVTRQGFPLGGGTVLLDGVAQCTSTTGSVGADGGDSPEMGGLSPHIVAVPSSIDRPLKL